MTTTAMVMSVGSLPLKVPMIDPWDSSPCIDADEMSPGPNSLKDSAEIQGEHPSFQARGHTLIIPPPVTQGQNLSVSTVVIGNFTL